MISFAYICQFRLAAKDESEDEHKTIGTHARCEADGSVNGRTALGKVLKPKQHILAPVRKVSVFTRLADLTVDDSDTEQEHEPSGTHAPSTEGKPRLVLALQSAVKPKPIAKARPKCQGENRQPGIPRECIGSLNDHAVLHDRQPALPPGWRWQPDELTPEVAREKVVVKGRGKGKGKPSPAEAAWRQELLARQAKLNEKKSKPNEVAMKILKDCQHAHQQAQPIWGCCGLRCQGQRARSHC